MKKKLRWVTTNKHNSPAAGATQGYMCLFADVSTKNLQNIKSPFDDL